jgi:hypothetical protein
MCVFTPPPQAPLEDPMNLFALYLADLNRLTRRERTRAAWYAFIILAPIAALILAHQLYGPSLGQIMGWMG